MSIGSRSPAVRDAIVLAAGNGDRFREPARRSKLLSTIAGTPLLTRTLTSAHLAGVTTVHLVLGYDAESVAGLAQSTAPSGLRIHPHLNRDWHEENGVSVLAARACLTDRRFAVLMGDHLFDAAALRRMLTAEVEPGVTLLCVDRRPVPVEVAEEATRVRTEGDRIVAIGKRLQPYDALDTGIFVCDPAVFDALEASRRAGDTTLSGGIRRLTASGRVRAVDIGDTRWCDVDTPEDLRDAERVAVQAGWRPPAEPRPRVAGSGA